MADERLVPFVPLTAERQRALEILQQAYAEGSIAVDELESRMEQLQEADSLAVVRQVVADLVPLVSTVSAPMALAHDVPGLGFVVSVMGGAEKRGAWLVPRRSFVWTTMGGTELDYRDALFGPGVHEVFVFAMWGGVDLIVPPTIHVQVEGIGIMGGFGSNSNRATAPNAPTLRVIGAALMGGVDVDVRFAGESARDARRRRKQEAKQLAGRVARPRLGSGSEPSAS